ncbi:hypothetical protein LTR56_023373 [Elasticomyces elasticus]|nr:hypothetical protein LTR56_023373 [Elasticomyces elasticus]KAK3623926.1 hypothetical protein LTR22_024176 [Elasticomyces elasticus]KAK4906248.1 hypothetical protein LTR49_024581 [Elasticomyces elasticus]
MTLQMGWQNMLADSSLLKPSMLMMFSRQKCSYNQNCKPRGNAKPSMDSRNRKLMVPLLATTFINYDPWKYMASPQSSFADPCHIPLIPQYGCRMSFDSGCAENIYMARFDVSGNITLHDLEISSVFDVRGQAPEAID